MSFLFILKHIYYYKKVYNDHFLYKYVIYSSEIFFYCNEILSDFFLI